MIRKKILNIAASSLLLFFFQTFPHFLLAQQEIKVMSYNIRLDVKNDGENWWEVRKDRVAALMNYYEADFIGGQEVQHHQLQYLLSKLTTYSFVGVGRDDGKEAGEYSCIFYRKDKYKVLKQSTFWLSPSPDSVGKGWDAAYNRVCSYGLFKDKKTKKKFWVFNAHLDHIGKQARLESVKLITKKVSKVLLQNNLPVIITGDFNSKPNEEPAQYMSTVFLNARNICTTQPYGSEDTWNGFQFDKKPDGCIDYIFVNNKMEVSKFATITDSYDKKYPSDHFPILATLKIKK
ncbi:MAG: endonuclease/exonuclease/phosphatase family protein [Chitinophagaceae bacterium]|nr:endonuclease/exonuclease/phosphatase family protein [Chitinophagaceae bacterium]